MVAHTLNTNALNLLGFVSIQIKFSKHTPYKVNKIY